MGEGGGRGREGGDEAGEARREMEGMGMEWLGKV